MRSLRVKDYIGFSETGPCGESSGLTADAAAGPPRAAGSERGAAASGSRGPGEDSAWLPDSGNTGASNPKSINATPEWRGREDTIEMGFYVSWPDFSKLEAFRAEADKASADIAIQCGSYLGIFKPHGRAGFPYRRFVFEVSGIEFQMSAQAEPKNNTPNVYVRIGSKTLAEMRTGTDAVNRAAEVVAILGGTITNSVISRVDLCLDLVGQSIDDFAKLYSAGWYVSRSRKDSMHREARRVTGMTFGKSDVMLRIYDKTLELREGGNGEKIAALLNVNNLEEMPESWTRVEFQLRGDALKAWCVRTWEQYMTLRAGIVRCLVEDWFRFVREGCDIRHSDRAETHGLWVTVQNAFGQEFGTAKKVRRVYADNEPMLVPLQQQVAGLAVALAAKTSKHCGSARAIMRRALEEVAAALKLSGNKKILDKHFLRVAKATARQTERFIPFGRRVGTFTLDDWASIQAVTGF